MSTAARALVLLAVAGAFLALGVAPYLDAAPRTGLSRDLYAYFFPRYVHVGRAVAGGELPLWNPWELCGVPFLASAQAGALNPLVALVFGLLPGEPALVVHHVLHLALCGALLWTLARALGLGAAGAAVAAVAWMVSPALTHSLYHPNRIAGLVWMPVVFGLGLRAAERGGGRWAAALAVALALQIPAGYPEFALDTALLLGLATACGLGAANGWDAGRAARGLGWLAVAGVLALSLAGIQVLPTLELVGESARELTAARPVLSPGPRALPTLFGLRADVGAVHLGMLPAFYPGGAALVLAAVGAALGPRGVRLPFLAGAVACMLGVVAFEWLHRLPFYRSTRFSLPWALILPFFPAVLAGAGVEALVARGEERRRRVAAAALAAIVGLVLAFGQPASRLVALLALAPAALALGCGRRAAAAAAAVAAALVLGEAILASPYRGGTDPFPPLPHPPSTQALLRALRDEPAPVRFLGSTEAARGVAVLERVDGMAGLEESVMPRRLRRIVEHFGMRVGLPHMALRLEAVARSKPLFDLLGVAYVAGPASWAAGLESAGLVPIHPPTAGGDGVWRNAAALPRAFLVHRVHEVPDAEAAFAAVSAPDFRPRETAVVEAPLDVALGDDAGRATETVRIVRRDPEEVVVSVTAASPALLVLVETHFPGWRVRIGDAPAELVRADYAFRGVVVPAGTSEVTFTYAPASVRRGAALGLLGLVLAAALWRLAPRPA